MNSNVVSNGNDFNVVGNIVDLNVVGKNLKVTKAIRHNVEVHAEALTKYHDKIVNVNVVLEQLPHQLVSVEVVVNVLNKTLFAQAEDDNLYNTIDLAFLKVRRQLKKFNGKMKDKRVKLDILDVEE